MAKLDRVGRFRQRQHILSAVVGHAGKYDV
jgi:hypothetical protein